MSQLSTEKTQAPTPYRRQMLRREGRFPRSSELVGTIILGGLLLVSPFFVRQVLHSGREVLRESFTASVPGLAGIDVAALTRPASMAVLPAFCTLACGVILLAVIANVSQRSAGWKVERLAPDLSRLSPIRRFTTVFSVQKWSAGFLALGRFFVTIPVVVWWLWSQRHEVAGLSFMSPDQLAEAFTLLGRQALLVALGSVALWSAADYVLQWWSLERSIRMTPDEIREEARKRDGDPILRMHRRSRHAQLVGPTRDANGFDQEA